MCKSKSRTAIGNMAMVMCAATSLLLLGSGCNTPWTVIQSADPNPLRNQKQFGLRAVEMKDVMVDDRTEENFKSTRNPDQIKNWEADKAAIQQLFAKTLIEEAAHHRITISQSAANGGYAIEPTVIT